jgi:hypothetical protein
MALQRSSKFLFVTMMSCTAASMLLVAAANFFGDPFQFFRQARDPAFSELMQRYQAPGVVRNYSFSKIIVGSSTMANLKSSLFETLGESGVQNLSLWGGTLNEAYNLVQLGLRKHKLTAIYWAIDPVLLLSDYRYRDFPQCMYDRVWQFWPYCYLFNRGVLNEVIASRFDRVAISEAASISEPCSSKPQTSS